MRVTSKTIISSTGEERVIKIGGELEIKNADDKLFKAIMTSDVALFEEALAEGANISGVVTERQERSDYGGMTIVCDEGVSYYAMAFDRVLESVLFLLDSISFMDSLFILVDSVIES